MQITVVAVELYVLPVLFAPRVRVKTYAVMASFRELRYATMEIPFQVMDVLRPARWNPQFAVMASLQEQNNAMMEEPLMAMAAPPPAQRNPVLLATAPHRPASTWMSAYPIPVTSTPFAATRSAATPAAVTQATWVMASHVLLSAVMESLQEPSNAMMEEPLMAMAAPASAK